MKSLLQLSATEMRDGLLSKEFTSEELTQAHLAHIEKTNKDLNSFVQTCEETAIDSAKAADKTLATQGDTAPLLCGIPIGVKDMIVTKDIETRCASNILSGFIPPYDATVVQKIKAAGAVILGKTNQDEFAMGSSTEHSAYGPSRNAWNQDKVPGGSSGGSAISVAAFQTPLALGTDTGGSVRQPASFNGVLGMKPTYGRVSRYGVVAYASSCDQVGPFARSAEDLAILLETISGFDQKDSTSTNLEVPSFYKDLTASDSLRGKTIGVPKAFLEDGIQSEVLQAFNSSIEQLEALGARVIEVELPTIDYALAAYYVIVCAEASSNLSRYDGVRFGKRTQNAKSLSELYSKTRAEGFGTEVKRRIMMGTYALSAGYYDAYYKKAQQVRTLLIEDFKKVFASCDYLATPTAPSTAFNIGEKTGTPLEMYLADVFTVPANLIGAPGVSIPVGFDKEGLPIGLQLLAPSWAESDLLLASKLLMQENSFDNTSINIEL